MSNPSVNSAVQLLAEKLKDDRRFMAFVLEEFCKQEGIGATELPDALEMIPEMVTRLALCRTPEPDAGDFGQRVKDIAYYTLADEGILANVIRRVSSIQALGSVKEEAFLAAARDHELTKNKTDQNEEDEKEEI